MSLEERILNIAEAPAWYDSRELRAIALDVRKMEERIKQLEDWKESALAVEREWNANAIATMLGGQPGESQREVIQREVPKLLERIKRLEGELESTKADRDSWSNQSDEFAKTASDLIIHIKRLEEAGKELRECASQLGWTSSEDPRWIGRAEAAVEAWDKEAKP